MTRDVFTSWRGSRAWLLGLALIAVLVGFGCGPKEAATGTKDTVATDTGGKSVDSPDGNKDEKSAPGEEAADPATIPANLKGDAYAYYGLDNPKALKFEMTATGQSPMSGEQTVKFTGMKDGKAMYSVERTGDLANNMGNQEMELSEKGLFVTSTSMGSIGEPTLELPFTLKAGDTWNLNQKLETTGGQSIETKSVYKIVGNQKVKTKGGDFDALLITATGPATYSGNTVQMEMKAWYVKGYGAVKSEINTKDKTGKTSKVSIELTK